MTIFFLNRSLPTFSNRSAVSTASLYCECCQYMDLNIVSELFLQISCIWYLVIGIFVCVAPNYDSIHSSALLNGIVCVQGFHLTVESREMTGKEGRARGRNAE